MAWCQIAHMPLTTVEEIDEAFTLHMNESLFDLSPLTHPCIHIARRSPRSLLNCQPNEIPPAKLDAEPFGSAPAVFVHSSMAPVSDLIMRRTPGLSGIGDLCLLFYAGWFSSCNTRDSMKSLPRYTKFHEEAF